MGEPHDHVVTRSEEELVVDTVWRPAERVRLRRRLVEEEVTVTVTVQREELHIEREPIPESVESVQGRPSSAADDEVVIVLREERPVVGIEVVPRELVRVRRYLVAAGEELVSESLRREVIEIDGVDEHRHPA